MNSLTPEQQSYVIIAAILAATIIFCKFLGLFKGVDMEELEEVIREAREADRRDRDGHEEAHEGAPASAPKITPTAVQEFLYTKVRRALTKAAACALPGLRERIYVLRATLLETVLADPEAYKSAVAALLVIDLTVAVGLDGATMLEAAIDGDHPLALCLEQKEYYPYMSEIARAVEFSTALVESASWPEAGDDEDEDDSAFPLFDLEMEGDDEDEDDETTEEAAEDEPGADDGAPDGVTDAAADDKPGSEA